ncbi:MAG: response regulator [Candidatus Omnitrophota bacterium]
MGSKKILIVDDEPDILRSISFRVKKAGYEVICAEDGGEGLEKAREEKPDLIILDYRMPVLDGIEVYKKLRENGETSRIPVIFLTASRESAGIRDKLEEIGADSLMTKPYDANALLNKINELLDR